ncbi:MAG: SDR family oxidoreductase [Limisphaerales bacterium]
MGRQVFITGATGYMGQRLVPLLLERGHTVKVLVRKGSEAKAPSGTEIVIADPLETDSYTKAICPADTFIHLIGVPHPSPSKAKQFREIDFVSAQVAIDSAKEAGVKHFIYLSVAHPAPMMHAYIAVRSECEETIRKRGLTATILRPWYVLGPGHRWPSALTPLYWVCERLPATREAARRLGLVTLQQTLDALVWSVENPPAGIRVLGVPEIRASSC